MKAKTINENASRLMADHNVKARVEELKAPVEAKVRLTYERWLREIDRCATYDVRKMFDTHGNPKEIVDLDDDSAPAIAGYEFTEDFVGKKDETRTAVGYTKKVKLIDKIRALELAGKARGYYEEIDASKLVPQIQVVFVNAAQPGSAPGRIDEAAPIEVAFVRRR